MEGVGLGINGKHLPLRELREADGVPKSHEPAMTLRYIFFLLRLTLLLRGEAAAHHAFSPVSDERRTVTIQGTVTEFRLVNPHATMMVDVVDKAGKHVLWTVELAGLLSLS